MNASPSPREIARWIDQAACRDLDPTLFLVDDPTRVSEAVRVCGTCPVRSQCLQLGLQQRLNDDIGIWGGTTPADRVALRAGKANTQAHAPTRAELAVARKPRTHGPPAPTVPLTVDDWGIHHDPSGRITICPLERPPRLMVLLDDRPAARVQTLAQARKAAWCLLNQPTTPVRATTAAPATRTTRSAR